MNEIICDCGHTINWHGAGGCHDSDKNDATCKCRKSPLAIASEKIRLIEKQRDGFQLTTVTQLEKINALTKALAGTEKPNA